MKKLLLALALLASPVLAEDFKLGIIGPFGGLNNSENSLTIPANAAQDLLNVDITDGGKSVKKREGYAQAFALGVTTNAVHGTHVFYDASGNDVVLAFNDTRLTASVAGASPSLLMSSATVDQTWQCVDSQGFAYCAGSSREWIIKTNGATWSQLSGFTATGTIVAVTPERLVQAGFSGSNSNGVHFSKANDFATWTVGAEPTDPISFTITTPGSRITHLTYAHKKIYWFKESSFGYILEGAELADWKIKVVSSDIGTLDNTSTQDTDGNLYFRGQDGHIYVTDGGSVTKLSKDIDGTLATAQGRTLNSWTQTSTVDFDAGAVSPTSSLTTTSGQIVLASNPTETDTSDAHFMAGTVLTNVSTTTTGGELARKWFTVDNWNDGNYSSNGPWTVNGGAFSVSSSELISNPGTAVGAYQNISTTFTATSGTWRINGKITSGGIFGGAWGVWFMAGAYQAGNGNYASGYMVYASQSGDTITLFESDSSGNISSLQSASITEPGSSYHTMTITRTSAGVMNVYWDGSLKLTVTDTTVTSSANTAIHGMNTTVGGSAQAQPGYGWDDFYYSPAVDGSGTPVTSQAVFESQVFDNTAALSTYDTFAATLSTATGHVVNFYTATSDDGSSFDAYVLVATGTSITSTDRRYIKYKAVFSSLADSQNGYFTTPTIQDVTVGRTLNAGHLSAVKNAPSISAWDAFTANKADNSGTFNFYIRAAAGSFTVNSSTPNWTEVAEGAIPSTSTGVYFQILSSFTVTASGQNPTLYDFTQSWFEGSAEDKTYATFFDDRVMFAVAAGAGQATNNRLLIYDLITPGWTLYDLPVNGFYKRNQSLYFGSSSAGYVYKFGGVDSDNGSAIEAYWKSKDFFMDSPFVDKEIVNISVMADSVTASSMTVTYTVNGSSSSAYTVALQSANTYARSNKNLPLGRVGNTLSIQFGNDATDQPFEVFALSYGYREKAWKPE